MCRIQNTCDELSIVHPLSGRLYALLIDSCLLVIKHIPCCGVTCVLKFCRKKCQPSIVSPSTMANANGNMLLVPSCATAINNVPLYLPYSHVPSICTVGLQNANASMHALNDQKSQWNMTLFEIGWLDSSNAWIVWILTIVSETKSCKTCRNLGSMLYYSSQLPYTCSRAHCFASHALRYVMVYPNSCLTNAMNVGMVSCSFSSTIARIFLPTSFKSFLLWSCEMVGMMHVWGLSIILISQTFKFFRSNALSFHWHPSTWQYKTHVSFAHLLC